jgi:hypothetical protein
MGGADPEADVAGPAATMHVSSRIGAQKLPELVHA